MTRPLTPEAKALRAIDRALRTMDSDCRRATIEWLYAREHNATQDEVDARFRVWPLPKRPIIREATP